MRNVFWHKFLYKKKVKQGRRRGSLGILLAAAVILQTLPFGSTAVYASESSGSGLCEHHTEHTSDCGYQEAEPGAECTHAHTEDCYRTAEEEAGDATQELDCCHEHDESCGYREGTEKSPCTFVCEICNGEIMEEDGKENNSETETSGTETYAYGREETSPHNWVCRSRGTRTFRTIFRLCLDC